MTVAYAITHPFSHGVNMSISDSKKNTQAHLKSGFNKDFWSLLGIRDIESDKTDSSDAGQLAAKCLRSLTSGNLALLWKNLGGAVSFRAEAPDLVRAILNVVHIPTICNLLELLKRRAKSVEQVYRAVFSETTRKKHQSVIEEFGSSNETIKALTQLLVLFNLKPQHATTVFFEAAWEAKTTSFELDLDITATATRKLQGLLEGLAKPLGTITRHGVRSLGVSQISDGSLVAVYLREYPPRVKRDFKSGFTVFHDCGLVVLGVSKNRQTLHLKSANKGILNVVVNAFNGVSSNPVVVRNRQVFSGFDPEAVNLNLTGGYSNEHGIELIELVCSRTALPGKCQMTLKALPLEASLRPDLEILRENSMMSLNGVQDIESMKITFNGKIASIVKRKLKDGTPELLFEDGGWPIQEAAEFKRAFHKTFGLELNMLIDPASQPLGSVGIIEYLLGIKRVEDVLPHQEDVFEMLENDGVLKVIDFDVKLCANNLCKARNAVVTDKTRVHCAACDQELEDRVEQAVNVERPILVRKIAEQLASLGWRLDLQEKKFEARSYFLLSKNDGAHPDEDVCLYLADRLSDAIRSDFERLSRPLIVCSFSHDRKDAYVDGDNIGHICLPLLLAAEKDDSLGTKLKGRLKAMLEKLQSNFRERIEKAARLSRTVLDEDRELLDGPRYEREIFNLLRIVFPYCHMLGREGKPEPDGYVCIPDYRTGSEGLADVESWNFIYDAKYSERAKGYDLNRDEARKMLEYIEKYRNARKQLDGRNNKFSAHVIISNQVNVAKIERCAEFLFGSDGLSEKNKDIKLVLMREEFVIEIYDWIQRNQNDFQTKRGYLLIELIDVLKGERGKDWIELDQAAARGLLAKMSNHQIIEKRVKYDVVESLADA